MQISKKIIVAIGSAGLMAGAIGAAALQIHAATNTPATQGQYMMRGFRHGAPPAAAGQVTAVNGNNIIITDQRTGTSYTVDASKASVSKFERGTNGQPEQMTLQASDIKVGDHVGVEGTVSGTSITATEIHVGEPARGGRRMHGPEGTAGTVSAVNGTTITLTGKDGQTYTVDASKAGFKKVTDSSISDVKAGDTLMVRGAVSGTSVTADQIMNGALPIGK